MFRNGDEPELSGRYTPFILAPLGGFRAFGQFPTAFHIWHHGSGGSIFYNQHVMRALFRTQVYNNNDNNNSCLLMQVVRNGAT